MEKKYTFIARSKWKKRKDEGKPKAWFVKEAVELCDSAGRELVRELYLEYRRLLEKEGLEERILKPAEMFPGLEGSQKTAGTYSEPEEQPESGCGKEEGIEVRLLEAEEWDTAFPYLPESEEESQKKDGFVFLAYCKGEPCGALSARKEADALYIVSLYVDEKYRNRGAATALLSGAEQLAVSLELAGIVVEYICKNEEEPGLRQFFLKRGYQPPQEGSLVYEVSLEALKESRLARLAKPKEELTGQILCLNQLPEEVLADYQSRLGKTIAPYLEPQEAVGDPIPELCLAYVEKERVRCALVTTKAVGTLHVAGIHLDDRQYAPALVALLKTALELAWKNYGEYGTVTATAAAKGGRNLAEQLLEGASCTRYEVYSAKKCLLPVSLPEGFWGAMFRCHFLAKALERQGIQVRFMASEGELPWLEADVDDVKHTARFFCMETGGKNEKRFLWEAETSLPRTGLLQRKMYETPDFAVPQGNFLPPGQNFPADAIVDSFVLPFLKRMEHADDD